jgi:hypothetical protein
MLVGSVIAVLGLAIGVYFYSVRPTPVTLEYIPPLESWVLWQYFKEGPVGRLDWEIAYEEAREQNRRWLLVSGGVVAIGILTMVSSLLVPKERATPGQPDAKTKQQEPESEAASP